MTCVFAVSESCFFEINRLSYVFGPCHVALHRSDNLWLSLGRCYVTSNVLPLVFDSLDSMEVSLIDAWGTWLLKVSFWMLMSFRLTSLFIITAMFIVPHLKLDVKIVL